MKKAKINLKSKKYLKEKIKKINIIKRKINNSKEKIKRIIENKKRQNLKQFKKT